MLQESGEHVLITAGEVHLQRCLQDLRENYAKIEVNASQPIVPFRETILAPLESLNDEAAGRIQITTSDKRFSLRLRAVSIPEEVTALLEDHVEIIKAMRQTRCGSDLLESTMAELEIEDVLSLQMRGKVTKLYARLDQAFRNANWGDAVNRILSFGPRRCGPNLLLNQSSTMLPNPWNKIPHETATERSILEFLSSVINGFQLATLAGPLCEEPLHGVAFIVEDVSILIGPLPTSVSSEGENSGESSNLQQQYGPLTGQIMSAVKDGCRRAFQTQPQRLMAAMYNCSIQVSGEVVGE